MDGSIRPVSITPVDPLLYSDTAKVFEHQPQHPPNYIVFCRSQNLRQNSIILIILFYIIRLFEQKSIPTFFISIDWLQQVIRPDWLLRDPQRTHQ